MADQNDGSDPKLNGAPVDGKPLYSSHEVTSTKGVGLAFDGDPDTLKKMARGEIPTDGLKGHEGDLASALVVEYPKGNSENGES